MSVKVFIVFVVKATARKFVVLLWMVTMEDGPCWLRVYQGSIVESDMCVFARMFARDGWTESKWRRIRVFTKWFD